MTKAEAFSEVMATIVADRNRTLERAILLGVEAGMRIELERIKTILEMPAPTALQAVAIAMALNGCSVEAVAGLVDLHTPHPVVDAEAPHSLH
jgi:hypothetical protein